MARNYKLETKKYKEEKRSLLVSVEEDFSRPVKQVYLTIGKEKVSFPYSWINYEEYDEETREFIVFQKGKSEIPIGNDLSFSDVGSYHGKPCYMVSYGDSYLNSGRVVFPFPAEGDIHITIPFSPEGEEFKNTVRKLVSEQYERDSNLTKVQEKFLNLCEEENFLKEGFREIRKSYGEEGVENLKKGIVQRIYSLKFPMFFWEEKLEKF